MPTITTNGQHRKSLASQLDRLDGILDALSDGLNEAVQHTVERAVKQALADLDLGQRLAQPSKPSLLRRLGGWLSRVVSSSCKRIAGIAKTAKHQVIECCAVSSDKARAASACAASALRRLRKRLVVAGQLAVQLRRPLVTAFAIGLTLGVASYIAGPVVAAALNAVAGMTISLAVTALRLVRRMSRLEPVPVE